MRLLPIMTYELRAAATPAELADLLRSHTEPARPFVRLGRLKPFWGRVDSSGFRITRVGRTRNFFRPTVHGTFQDAGGSSTVRISINHDPWVFIVVALFSLFFAGVCQRTAIPLIPSMVPTEAAGAFKALLPLLAIVGLLLFTLAISWLEFPSEANAAKKELDRLLLQISTSPQRPFTHQEPPLGAAEQLDGADPASPASGLYAVLTLGWPGGSSRGR